jgi:catechol 2,3-dioxygenase-like lactoylglutathione lyase family enzyme
MLNNAKIVAFVATADASKSRAFYEGVLGLALTVEDEFAVVFDANGVELRIQKVQALTPQPHTQLGWSVASIEEVVQALRAKGVAFEHYPFLQQNALGIWTAPSGAKVAWFKDPDGNILSVTEPARVETSLATFRNCT